MMTDTGVEPDAWGFLIVCVPIVVIFAPLGSIISSHFHRQVLAFLIYILDTVALVTAFIVIPITVELGIMWSVEKYFLNPIDFFKYFLPAAGVYWGPASWSSSSSPRLGRDCWLITKILLWQTQTWRIISTRRPETIIKIKI